MKQLSVSQSEMQGGGVEVRVELADGVHAIYRTVCDQGPLDPKLISVAVEEACPLGPAMCMPTVSIERAHNDDSPMAPVVIKCAGQFCISGQVLVEPTL